MDMGNTKEIFRILENKYKKAEIELKYRNPMQLLVAVILSAQCTDKRVNIVTKNLFKKYKTARDFANANLKTFQKGIYSTGFYRNKAKNIIATAKIIDSQYNGKVPRTMEEMLKLKGVARKTANVVLGNAYGVIEGIAVDTHVIRLSQRLGLSKNKDPKKIEQDLMKILPKEKWLKITYQLIGHGRQICEAKKPKCDKCPLNKVCPSAFKFKHFKTNS